MGLAACASALLLAVTNHLTQNVAAIPFLWVLPLSLYLLSFILCFDSDRWYNRWLFTRLAAVALPGIAFAISNEDVRERFIDRQPLPAFKDAISNVSNISDLKLALGSSASRCSCCSWCATGSWRAGGPRPAT